MGSADSLRVVKLVQTAVYQQTSEPCEAMYSRIAFSRSRLLGLKQKAAHSSHNSGSIETDVLFLFILEIHLVTSPSWAVWLERCAPYTSQKSLADSGGDRISNGHSRLLHLKYRLMPLSPCQHHALSLVDGLRRGSAFGSICYNLYSRISSTCPIFPTT